MQKTPENELDRIARAGRTTLRPTDEQPNGRRINTPIDPNDQNSPLDGSALRNVIWRWQMRRRRQR